MPSIYANKLNINIWHIYKTFTYIRKLFRSSKILNLFLLKISLYKTTLNKCTNSKYICQTITHFCKHMARLYGKTIYSLYKLKSVTYMNSHLIVSKLTSNISHVNFYF